VAFRILEGRRLDAPPSIGASDLEREAPDHGEVSRRSGATTAEEPRDVTERMRAELSAMPPRFSEDAAP
jgi:hypothetical protein